METVPNSQDLCHSAVVRNPAVGDFSVCVFVVAELTSDWLERTP